MPKPKKSVRPKRGKPLLLAVLTSSVVVAVVGPVLDKCVVPMFSHRASSPAHVTASARIEGDTVLVFVRNNSDEPLDLREAILDIDRTALSLERALGAYPDVSQRYRAVVSSGMSDLQQTAGSILVTIKIAQAIEPKNADQFSVSIVGPHGPARLASAPVKVSLVDMQGNEYSAR